jgi:hypothetical protein
LQAITECGQAATERQKEKHDAEIENVHDDFLSLRKPRKKQINVIKTKLPTMK